MIAFHGDRWVPDCIDSLAQSLVNRYDLVIVDNMGNCVLSELDLSHFESEIIESNHALGFAAANNLALSQSSLLSSYVAFLNQDTLSRNDWLRACIDCLESHPDIGAVSPLTRSYDWEGWDPYFLECAQQSQEFVWDLEPDSPLQPFYEVPVIPAVAMVVRTHVLKEAGPFDPIFGSYYEDYDLCHRIRHAGYRVGVCTAATIAHYSGSATNSPVAERQRARGVTRNRVIYRQRLVEGNRLLSLLRYLLLTFPRGLVRSAVGRQGAKPLGAYLLAHWDLFRLLPRLVSRSYDQGRWRQYLASIAWPPGTLGDRADREPAP